MIIKTNGFIKKHSGIFLIILLALLIRIVYLIIYSSLPDWNQLTVDNYYHHNWAISISEGNVVGDTTYFRAPFYIFCLAFLYKIFGVSLWVGRILGLVIGIFSIALTYRIGKKVFNHTVGLIAAFVQTFYPLFIYFESELLLDPLFTLLLQLTIYRLMVWWERKTLKDSLIVGIFLGLSAITRPTSLVLIPLIIILFISLLKKFNISIKHTILFFLGTLLFILPVSIRNIIIADDPVLIASQAGINLYIGNNDAADGISAVLPEPMGFNWRLQEITHLAETERNQKLKPGQVSSFWINKAISWIKENPWSFVRLYIKKLYHNFSNREISNNRNLPVFFNKIPHLKNNLLSFGILFSLMVVGFLTKVYKSKKALFLLALILTYVIVSALFFFSSRFRLPLLPFYIILASFTLYTLSNLVISNWRSAFKYFITVVVCGLFSFYPIVKLPKGSPSLHLISQGLYYSANKEYTKALDYFQQAHAIDPDFPETNLNIGTAFFRLGQTDSALFYFNKEKMTNPGRTKTQTNIASIYHLNGEFEKALREIQLPLQKRPYDVIANMVLIRTLLGTPQVDNQTIIDTVLTAAERTGDNIYLLNDAAILFVERGELEISETILLRALSSNPPPIETDDEAFERNFINSIKNWSYEKSITFYQLGYINGIKGDFPRAIDYSHNAIALDSNLVEAYINLISGYLSIGQFDKANTILQIGLEKFPANQYIKKMDNKINNLKKD